MNRFFKQHHHVNKEPKTSHILLSAACYFLASVQGICLYGVHPFPRTHVSTPDMSKVPGAKCGPWSNFIQPAASVITSITSGLHIDLINWAAVLLPAYEVAYTLNAVPHLPTRG